MQTEQGADAVYRVVINKRGQYSIWPKGRPPPDGWSADGVEGPKDECLSHIERVWRDIRPTRGA
jgi:MbtH protein